MLEVIFKEGLSVSTSLSIFKAWDRDGAGRNLVYRECLAGRIKVPMHQVMNISMHFFLAEDISRKRKDR